MDEGSANEGNWRCEGLLRGFCERGQLALRGSFTRVLRTRATSVARATGVARANSFAKATNVARVFDEGLTTKF